MNFTNLIHAVDVWAAGGPHRIITGGLPSIKGRTMEEKKAYIETNLPHLPSLLSGAVDDPEAMVAAILTEPADERADFGVIWTGCGEIINMCGTGTFAIGTALVEMGLVYADNRDELNVLLDLPVGQQKLHIHVRAGDVERVTTRVSPSYYVGDYSLDVPDIGTIQFDVAYGLNCLEPLIDCDSIGIDLIKENTDQLVTIAKYVQEYVGGAIKLPADLKLDLNNINQLSFYQNKPADSDADYRCMAIVGNGDVDTTPSGTSTCAHLAARYAKGEIRLNEELKVDSITGASLSGSVTAETEHHGRSAVLPEISGRGRITRLQSIVDSSKQSF